MKITMTTAVTEPPELHRADGGGDPAMAFLAALGQLLPGLTTNQIVPIPDGKSDTATVTLSGLSLDAKMPTADPNIVVGTSNLGKAIPVEVAPSAVVPPAQGSTTELAKSLLADLVTVPSHPLVAADRVGVPVAPVASVVSEASSIEQVPVPVPVQLASSVIVPPTQGSTTEFAKLQSTDRPKVPTVTVAPASTPNVVVTDAIAEGVLSPVSVVPDSRPRLSGIATAGSKVATEPALVADEAVEVSNIRTSSVVPVVPTSTTTAPVQDSAELDATVADAKLLPRSTERGSGRTKSVSSEPSHNGEKQVGQTSGNPVSVAIPSRTESASSIVATGSPRPAVAAQIAPYVAALRHEPDGTHQITVVLHPAELGQVRIVVELRDGTVNLQLSGAHDAARDALSTALPQLRRELTDSGLSVGRTDVLSQDSGSSGSAFAGSGFTGGGPRQGFQTGSMAAGAEDSGLSSRNFVEPAAPVVWRSAHTGAVDVSI